MIEDLSDDPIVSFGLAVRNGAGQLRQCLDCLTTQTLREIEIVISDNASTDETQAICEAYATRDPRIRYLRQKRDIGPMPNFLLVAQEAKGRYFAWRAHDDLSAPDFAEKLAQVLDAHPDAFLATGRIHWDNQSIGFYRSYRLPDLRGASRLLRALRGFISFTPHWHYGLYRREAAVAQMEFAIEEIGTDTYHWDIIAMSRLLVAGRVVAAPVTVFIGRRIGPPPVHTPPPDLAAFERTRERYWKAIDAGIADYAPSVWERAILRASAFRFLDRRVARFREVRRARRAARRQLNL